MISFLNKTAVFLPHQSSSIEIIISNAMFLLISGFSDIPWNSVREQSRKIGLTSTPELFFIDCPAFPQYGREIMTDPHNVMSQRQNFANLSGAVLIWITFLKPFALWFPHSCWFVEWTRNRDNIQLTDWEISIHFHLMWPPWPILWESVLVGCLWDNRLQSKGYSVTTAFGVPKIWYWYSASRVSWRQHHKR